MSGQGTPKRTPSTKNDPPPKYPGSAVQLKSGTQGNPGNQQGQMTHPTQPVVYMSQPLMAPIPIGGPVIVGGFLGNAPQPMICPNCRRQIVTEYTENYSAVAWIVCILLCLFGCFFICWIPFCFPQLRIGVHICPNCGYFIGHNRVYI